jgi:chemotaxis protein methyltransferase CheR
MNSSTFAQFRQLVYQHSGIELGPGKEALVYGRVSKRMRALGIKDEKQYLDHVLADATGDELVMLLDAISTNFTQFFREPDHFTLLEKFLKDALKSGRTKLRIWSAACSSGEEPYSIAMIAARVMEATGRKVDARILATDLSASMLNLGRAAIYPALRLKDIPVSMRDKFVVQHGGETADFTLVERLQQLVTFRRLNLAQPPYPMHGPFDVIFCRNVMIYFDKAISAGIVREAERLLRPGGLLLIGHSESLVGISTSLTSVRPSVYRQQGART